MHSLPGVAASCRRDTPRRSPGAWPARARQIAAQAGLAPVTRESGTWRGKATLQGGRRPLRRALTMPTLTAIRRNRDLAALFTRLRAAGKPREARPCRGNAQTPHPRQHPPARRTGMAGNKASTKPLTNTDTGRGLWPPARMRKARAQAEDCSGLRSGRPCAGTFSSPSWFGQATSGRCS
ncbi:MAG: transposase [Rhodobacterales bacterium]